MDLSPVEFHMGGSLNPKGPQGGESRDVGEQNGVHGKALVEGLQRLIQEFA